MMGFADLMDQLTNLFGVDGCHLVPLVEGQPCYAQMQACPEAAARTTEDLDIPEAESHSVRVVA